MAPRRNAVRVPAHRGAVVCSVYQSVSAVVPVRQQMLRRRVPSPGAQEENRDRARSPAVRRAPPHREPFLPRPFGSVAAKFAADTRHPSLACARRGSSQAPDHQSFLRVRAGRACKFYIPRCKSVSSSGHRGASPSGVLLFVPIAESPGVANRRMLRKNFLVRGAIVLLCAERAAFWNFSPPYRAVE